VINSNTCNHTKTKNKLVSYDTKCKGKHRQGYVYKDCCVDCGKEVTTTKTKE
jgi:hypothetical protein